MSNVFLVQCKQPLSLAANASVQFWSTVFETFSPDLFLRGTFFELANGTNFCVSSKVKSTIYKRRTPTPGNLDQHVDHTEHKRLVHRRQLQVYIYFSWQPANSYQLEIINEKKRFSFVTSHRINIFL